MRSTRRMRVLAAGVWILLIGFSLAPVGASSANISHSYHSVNPILNGSIVSLDPNHSDYVISANVNNGSRLLGVAVDSNDSLLAVDPGADTVQVATSGNANTVVTTLNGDINVGDQVAVSPFNGIGMKAVAGSHVIGLAQTAFSNGSSGAVSQQVTDKSGHSSSIQVGYIKLGIAIGVANQTGGGEQLSSLQKVAKSWTGHTVSTVRILISLIVAILALMGLVTLIYASIYGSIISIGRNPLAKYAVFRALGSVIGLAVLTAFVASFTIFFLLR